MRQFYLTKAKDQMFRKRREYEEAITLSRDDDDDDDDDDDNDEEVKPRRSKASGQSDIKYCVVKSFDIDLECLFVQITWEELSRLTSDAEEEEEGKEGNRREGEEA